METANPYVSPTNAALDGSDATKLTFKHYLWFAITLATAILWAVFPIEEFPVRRLLQRSMYVWLILMTLPAIYWEIYCRRTPRPAKLLDSFSSSGARWMFFYLFAFVLSQSLFASLAGQMWSNGDAPMTPAMKVMYAKHALANACTVFFASGLLVTYDVWRSRRDIKWTEQLDERETSAASVLNG